MGLLKMIRNGYILEAGKLYSKEDRGICNMIFLFDAEHHLLGLFIIED
jgi:hypothetical protein